MFNKLNDIILLAGFGGTDNAHWFIQRDKYEILLFLRLDLLTVDLNQVSRHHLIASGRTATVNPHVALLHKAVGLTAGAHTTLANVLIDTGRFS